MKTREIEVWIPERIKDFKHEPYENPIFDTLLVEPGKKYAPGFKCDGQIMIKARLIIELPDRKVEISESEFDEIFYDHPVDMIDLDLVKQKLFGKDER